MTDDVGHFSCDCLLSVYFFSEMFVLFWFFKNWVMCFLFSEDRLLYVFWTQVLYQESDFQILFLSWWLSFHSP